MALVLLASFLLILLDPINAQCRPRALRINGNETTVATNETIRPFEPRIEITANSACATGIWLLYPLPQFNAQNLNAPVQYIFGPPDTPSGFTLAPIIAGQVNSFRSAGDPTDYRKDSLTLYEGPWFNGRQEYISKSLSSHLAMSQRSGSLIVTGNSSWTVYLEPQFRGNFKCIYPTMAPNYAPLLAPKVTDLQIPFHSIRSVRKGCFTKFAGFLNFFKPFSLTGDRGQRVINNYINSQ